MIEPQRRSDHANTRKATAKPPQPVEKDGRAIVVTLLHGIPYTPRRLSGTDFDFFSSHFDPFVFLIGMSFDRDAIPMPKDHTQSGMSFDCLTDGTPHPQCGIPFDCKNATPRRGDVPTGNPQNPTASHKGSNPLNQTAHTLHPQRIGYPYPMDTH